jgi:hypothetical protein
MSSKLGNTLKILAIAAMGLTSLFTLLGGVGTACIAWNADMYGARFAVFVPTMPLYQVFVYICVLVAMAGAVVTYALLRGDKWAYKGAVITLLIGLIVALAQMIHSSWLREVAFTDTMPTAMRFYITVLTLILFLILKLRGIRNRFDVDFTAPWRGKGSKSAGGGLTACIVGIATISCPVWAGASHMLEGYNLVNVLKLPLMVGGGLMILAGVVLLVPVLLEESHKQVLRSLQYKLRNAMQFTANTK